MPSIITATEYSKFAIIGKKLYQWISSIPFHGVKVFFPNKAQYPPKMTPIAIKIRLTILVFLLKYTKIFLVMEIISWIILENALEINSANA